MHTLIKIYHVVRGKASSIKNVVMSTSGNKMLTCTSMHNLIQIYCVVTVPAPFFLSKNPFWFGFYYVFVSFWFRFGFVSFFSV